MLIVRVSADYCYSPLPCGLNREEYRMIVYTDNYIPIYPELMELCKLSLEDPCNTNTTHKVCSPLRTCVDIGKCVLINNMPCNSVCDCSSNVCHEGVCATYKYKYKELVNPSCSHLV